MTERPILFSGPMVRAILDGQKSQTRRVLKPQPDWVRDKVMLWKNRAGLLHTHSGLAKPGDRLWVRETWQHYDWSEDGDPQIRHKADGALLWPSPPEDAYAALNERWAELSDPENYGIDNRAADRRWRPSIHMPKWAARIWLTVTEVRVQRLQDISEEDARAEGAATFARAGRDVCIDGDWWPGGPQRAFSELWNSIHGAGAWAANPWVAAITFERAP